MRFGTRKSFFAIVTSASLIAAGIVANPALARAQDIVPGRELTVQRIYSAPSLSGQFLSGMEWSPDGTKLSYFRETAGRRALWLADAATGAQKVLVSAEKLRSLLPVEKAPTAQRTGLGRVTPERYFWSPDGQALLFVTGGNMTLLNLASGETRSFAACKSDAVDPQFSPDGKWIGFVCGYNLFVARADNFSTTKLTTDGSEALRDGQLDWVYPEELDIRTAYWWSPDSSKIAYLQMNERYVTQYPIINMASPTGELQITRYPQAGETNPTVRVGVVAVSGGATTWMDTGANTNVYLARVNWLPDSTHVAIQRINRQQNRLDLLFADASTGASKTILSETDKYWINVSDILYFFPDSKRFIWSSERTGFRHLYLYDTSGKLLDQLTSGDWAVSGIEGFGPGTVDALPVDEAHGYIYFLSNKDNVTETQLYRLSLADKSLTRITQAAGTHFVDMGPGAKYFVDTFSTAMTPPRQDLCRANGTRVAALNENKVPEFGQYALSPVKFLHLRASDGTTLYADLILPPDFDPSRKYPVLISVYGGPEAQTVRNAWGGVTFLWQELMAEKGYIIFSLDNRGTYGRGHAFETPIYHHFGRIELEDQLTGVHYLTSLPYVDPTRIGIWGWSYGGYMTLTAMFNAPGVFRAGVAVAPVTDWRLYDTIYTERYMGTPQSNPAGYKDSSPVTHASLLQGKLMVAHGTGDDNVHFANTAELLNALIAAGKYPADIMVFPGRGHPISDPPARIQLFERITQFFLNNL